jgi:hypothetical protein
VQYLRGFLEPPGGAANASINAVGGKKILTGPEIHAHALNALTGPAPHTKAGNLAKYPKGEDPSTRSANALWLDADPGPRGTETAEEAVRRQKLAIAEICSLQDVVRENVQQLLAHHHGAAPRAVMLPGAEDKLDPTKAAHTSDKHTIGGGGSLNTDYQLAARACYSPTAGGQASAFTSPANAQEAIQAALDDYIATSGWPWLRGQLSKGLAVAFDQPVAGDKSVWLRTAGGGGGPNGLYDQNGDGTYVNQAAKPKNDGGRGGRHYYPGDGGAIPNRGGFVVRSNAPNALFETFGDALPNRIPVEASNLTTVVAATGVHVRLIGMNVNGGFVINSAYAY